MAQSLYCFPILELEELLPHIRSIHQDIDVSEHDFRDPKKDRWQRFYTLLLCNCCADMTSDSLNLMASPTMELQYPEIYQDSLSIFNLLKCLQALLTTCGVDDFKMSDIINPKPKRLIKICCAILNFRRFQEDRLEVYKSIKQRNEDLQSQRDQKLKNVEELSSKIEAIKSKRAENEPEARELKTLINEKKDLIEKLHKTVSETQKELTEKKTYLAEKTTVGASLKEQLVSLKQEDGGLSAQIVPSPDRLQRDMERMRRQSEQGQLTRNDQQERLRELRQRRILQTQREQEADQANKQLESLIEELNKQSEILNEMAQQKEDVAMKRDEMKQLDSKAQLNYLQLSTKQERRAQLVNQHSLRMEDLQASLDRCTRDMEEQQHVFSSQKNTAYRAQQDLSRLKDEEKAENDRHQREMDFTRGKYHTLLAALESYHQRLEKYAKRAIAAV